MSIERNDSATADIALNGDVILVVGAGLKRLKAYSCVLKSASKVFSAMLGPRFSEGQRLNDNESTEIDMPEDDAEAMEIMLNVIHGCNNAVDDGLNGSQILRVAITADKFDCKVALSFAIKVWLNCANITDSNQLWRLLKAAYWFDNAKSFEEISLGLILHHRGSYLKLWAKDNIDTDILIRICLLLEENRNRIRQSLLEIVIEEPVWQCWSCFCGWFSKHYLAYIQSLRSQQLPGGIFWMAVSEAIKAVYGLRDPQPKYTDLMDNSCLDHRHLNGTPILS